MGGVPTGAVKTVPPRTGGPPAVIGLEGPPRRPVSRPPRPTGQSAPRSVPAVGRSQDSVGM